MKISWIEVWIKEEKSVHTQLEWKVEWLVGYLPAWLEGFIGCQS